MAIWQRINLFCKPVLAFFAGFAALMGAWYFWLGGMPARQMAQMIGLLGSGIVVSIIVLFVGRRCVARIDVYELRRRRKEGFGIAGPDHSYLIAMLVAISVFRTTGCMDYLIGAIRSVVLAVGLNDDFVPALPVGLMKTLSGSGARGLMVDAMTTYGVDSFRGKLAAIIQGSTETTFYVLAVCFGSVNIARRARRGWRSDRRRRRAGQGDPDRLRLLSLNGCGRQPGNGRNPETAVFAGTDHAPGLTDALQLLLTSSPRTGRRRFDGDRDGRGSAEAFSEGAHLPGARKTAR